MLFEHFIISDIFVCKKVGRLEEPSPVIAWTSFSGLGRPRMRQNPMRIMARVSVIDEQT